jgi:hypothetical protein
MLFVPFRSRATHIVAFRTISPDVANRIQRADKLTELAGKDRSDVQYSSHVTLHRVNPRNRIMHATS